MSGINPISQTLNVLAGDPCWKCSFPQLEQYRSSICSHPLVERVTANWKVILMDCSTIIAITCFAITLLTGSTLMCSAFAIAAIASGVAAFYMRRFAVLSDLEDTAQGLKETKEKFEEIAKDLEKENNRLSESNRELQRNNETFRVSNQNLIQTNARLTQQVGQLTLQVTQLTLQVTQLRESAERIRTEVHHFQQANSHLHINVRALDQQIANSRALCDQIGTQLASHQQGIGQQLEQLRRYLADLSADNRVHERIQELAALHQQTMQATSQLQGLQLQYAAERAKFQEVREALVQIRDQFDAALQSNNRLFGANITALSTERQRLQQLIDRHFATARTA